MARQPRLKKDGTPDLRQFNVGYRLQGIAPSPTEQMRINREKAERRAQRKAATQDAGTKDLLAGLVLLALLAAIGAVAAAVLSIPFPSGVLLVVIVCGLLAAYGARSG